MIEVIAALIRWLQLASNMILIGGYVFLAMAARARTACDFPWLTRLERALPWLAVTLLLGLLGVLATTTAQVTDVAANVWRPQAWVGLLQDTRIGHIWMGRAALALLLFGVALYVRCSSRARWRYLLCATVASLTLAVASLASHSAAGDLSVTSVLPYALHIVLASATSYGWFLDAKLALLAVILVIAARARLVWLPALSQRAAGATAGGGGLRQWVTVEVGLAAALVLAATLLANAVPAKHDVIEHWPYPFRFSLDATWGQVSVMIRAGVGVALLGLAGGTVALGRTKGWGTKWHMAIPAALAAGALAVALPPLAVPAYPETYRKTPVPFDAISVANGVTLFAANCVACHGPQAKGNGMRAKEFPKPPVDLLTEPHTALHTAGDFFHWLTYGIPGTGMPEFSDELSEEDRWDVVNFLHATSRGYQARLINPYVAPNQPYMAPQNFSYAAHDGTSGTLKDFRRQKAVLLVLFSWPESRARLEQLRLAYASLRDSQTVVLAVPVNHPSPQDLGAITADIPFPVVTQGAPEIARSYALFRRTLSNPDLAGEGTVPKHMEFLMDRYGYLRARWIPAVDGAGWTDTVELMRQIDQLNREKEILPPPDDHVH